MGTTDEFARLRAEGVGPHDQILVGHYFSHVGSSRAQMQAFRDSLEAAGFGGPGGEIDSDTEGSDDYYWHHWSFTVVAASETACERLNSLAADIAQAHGAIYNDWRVARGIDGTLSPVDS